MSKVQKMSFDDVESRDRYLKKMNIPFTFDKKDPLVIWVRI